MPTYTYVCKDCEERLEVVRSFSDDALTVCPTCDGTLRQVFKPAGIVFKGSGWHIKDYAEKKPSSSSANGSSSATSEGASSATSEGASSSTGDTGSSGSSSSSGGGSSEGSSSSSGSSAGESTSTTSRSSTSKDA